MILQRNPCYEYVPDIAFKHFKQAVFEWCFANKTIPYVNEHTLVNDVRTIFENISAYYHAQRTHGTHDQPIFPVTADDWLEYKFHVQWNTSHVHLMELEMLYQHDIKLLLDTSSIFYISGGKMHNQSLTEVW